MTTSVVGQLRAVALHCGQSCGVGCGLKTGPSRRECKKRTDTPHYPQQKHRFQYLPCNRCYKDVVTWTPLFRRGDAEFTEASMDSPCSPNAVGRSRSDSGYADAAFTTRKSGLQPVCVAFVPRLCRLKPRFPPQIGICFEHPMLWGGLS